MQRALGVADHHLAIQGRLHTARQSVEQAHAQSRLQLLQQQTGCRLRGVHRRGRPAQVAKLAQGIEQGDLPAGNLQGSDIAQFGRRGFWLDRHIKFDIDN
ncbi:hypothetical protein D3C84_1096510 [compost metagenome]